MASLLDTNLRKKIQKRRHEERDHRIWRRLSAILWLDEGVAVAEVAARLGVSAKQIRRWLKSFQTHGLDGLCQLQYQGRIPRLNDSQIDELKQEIAKGQFHTAQHIVEWIGMRFKVCFSLSGVKDLLSRSRVCPPCWTTWTSIMLNWIPR